MSNASQPVSREDRHRLILSYLSRYDISSQTQLVTYLRSDGVDVRQATISRDLDALGVFKVRLANGDEIYRPPGRPDLSGVLRMYALMIEGSGQLCVVRTPPGSGPPVAAAIDGADLPDVLATIQGDDTVLIIAREPASGHDIAAALNTHIHISPSA
ncbi:arginine repressor [Stomatohabitans albus]|uniref:arginine repressor n=1 Tax=Stomatohabitans albus TaxID=3110766 RepID=UPI00300C3A13